MLNTSKIHVSTVERVLQDASLHWSSTDLQRLRATLDIWTGKIVPEPYHGQVAKGFFMPGLKDEAWISPSCFKFVDTLRENFLNIRREAQQFVNGTIVPPPYGLGGNAPSNALPLQGNPKQWREWRLYRAGTFYNERCRAFPETTRVLHEVLNQTSFMMNAIFLIMGPGEHLRPHTDQNNIFVNVWLPLETPSGCYLTIREKTINPKAGEIFSFNHSYTHSAGNFGNSNRIVLALSVFHPELTGAERQVIAKLAGMLTDSTNTFPY
ncbi:aspartyl/asparaginyl beta-hydroxylase domain-containing protein [Massilia aurea]|uniref:aspartyl/asparaginyl beta-hydroxylase domain-containing protein n=1 Tax=Massilia aurea TaxID=373040 RepID=UPI00216289CC|nr:aspartyl/asparaginyl beta-hydroxylase domain-containing protein [Massilia aurea]MCS0709964.1 aspartyl/asparaginyl beta-hydroxylase domain-containing protein [Massilia aurea]